MSIALGFEHLLTDVGWLSPGVLDIDDSGVITAVGPMRDGVDVRSGFAIPGMPNVHSHAFQRAFAGHSEFAGSSSESFWTWREAMYRVALEMTPEQAEAVAAMVQLESLENGYTSIGEFHYLHHAPDGSRYASCAEMAERVLAAADRSGIAVTMLPVLYQLGGFGRPAQAEQRRFVHSDLDRYFELVQGIRDAAGSHRVGIAPHSLRAVDVDVIREAVATLSEQDADAPIHIHVSEQRAEVAECVDVHGARPVRLLLDAVGIDESWCLVHATHLDETECRDLAASGAVAGLCPTTEANLGDGFFPIHDYLAAGGRIAIGSDSHISIDAAEELRLLEYGARLRSGERNVCHPDGGAHVGHALWTYAAAQGARALGQPVGALQAGRRADVVVLDPRHPRLQGHGVDTVIDAHVFSAAGHSAVRDVFVGGRQVVQDGRHVRRDEIVREFGAAL